MDRFKQKPVAEFFFQALLLCFKWLRTQEAENRYLEKIRQNSLYFRWDKRPWTLKLFSVVKRKVIRYRLDSDYRSALVLMAKSGKVDTFGVGQEVGYLIREELEAVAREVPPLQEKQKPEVKE